MSYYVPQEHVVHKHLLPVQDEDGNITTLVKLTLPDDARITLFDMQGPDFFIWEYHNTTFPKSSVERTFLISGTGLKIPAHLKIWNHIGSIQVVGFVWHLFEVIDQSDNIAEQDNV